MSNWLRKCHANINTVLLLVVITQFFLLMIFIFIQDRVRIRVEEKISQLTEENKELEDQNSLYRGKIEELELIFQKKDSFCK